MSNRYDAARQRVVKLHAIAGSYYEAGAERLRAALELMDIDATDRRLREEEEEMVVGQQFQRSFSRVYYSPCGFIEEGASK